MATSDEAPAVRPETPRALAVVECEGGRFRRICRSQGTVVACIFRAKSVAKRRMPASFRRPIACSITTRSPSHPSAFLDPKHVAKIAETEALSVAALPPGTATRGAVAR